MRPAVPSDPDFELNTRPRLKEIAAAMRKVEVGSAKYEALVAELDTLIFDPEDRPVVRSESRRATEARLAEEWERSRRE
jgi:hypothetical protein